MTQQNTIQKSFGINFKILKIFAIYPLNAEQRDQKIFKIYGFIHHIFITVGFPFLGIIQLITDKNMDMLDMVDSLFVLSQLSLFPLKHYPFLVKYTELDALVKKLNTPSFSHNIPEQKKILQESIKTCRFIFKLLCGLCSSCCIFYTLRPLYLNISIPTKIWWPFDINNEHSTSRYFAWFFCAYSGCHGVFSTSAIDTLISGLVIHATGQLKILKNNLQFLEHRAIDVVDSSVKQKVIKRKLLEFADHYNDIIRFVKDVEDLLSTAVFVQIVGSSVVICMMCYMLTLVPIYSVTGISFTVYIAAMLFQIFFYCFFGNDLKAESSSITEAIYMSEWYTYTTESRKILLIIMERAKKPLVQTAGKVLVLSLPLFVTVLKQAYSLMAVLQNTNHNN